jgi:hypothetical protein
MNKEKGYLYEIQIRDYIINSLNKPAYLWSHTPETILLENNIISTHNDARLKRKELKEDKLNPLQDTGIDIIQLENDGKCSIVQCKNGYKKGITMNDLAGFMCWMTHLDKLDGYVYYTNKLSINLRSLSPNPRIHYVKEPYIEPVNTDIISTENLTFNIDAEKLKYQLIAFEAAKEYYKEIEIDEEDETVVQDYLVHAYIKIDNILLDSNGITTMDMAWKRLEEWEENQKHLVPEMYRTEIFDEETDKIPEWFFNNSFCNTGRVKKDMEEFLNNPIVKRILRDK